MRADSDCGLTDASIAHGPALSVLPRQPAPNLSTAPSMTLPNLEIVERLHQVRSQINEACTACGRSSTEVALLAVSKMQPAEAVFAAWQAGQRCFGENYVQEGLAKIDAVQAMITASHTQASERLGEPTDHTGIAADTDPDRPQWHLIGPLQSNKTRAVAQAFDWVHSVERFKIAQRLSEQRPEELAPLNLCLQVNLDSEDSKSGLVDANDVYELAHQVAVLPRIRLRGLMAIPAPDEDTHRLIATFGRLTAMLHDLQRQGLAVDTLSMGMSADMTQAIAAGSTMVRVGTAIFGQRA